MARHENPPQGPRTEKQSTTATATEDAGRVDWRGSHRACSRICQPQLPKSLIRSQVIILAMVTTSSPGQIHALDLIVDDEESELSESMIPSEPAG